MSHKHLNIFLIVLTSILLAPSNVRAQKSQSDQHIEVSLRMIGHQVLLNSGDSISRVLPIKKENGRYRIPFESDFELRPDELVEIVNGVMKDAKMTNGYIVEVEQCEAGEVVYSYEMTGLDKIDIIPCKRRDLPKSCYSLLLTLLDDNEQIITSNSVASDAKRNQLKYSIMFLLGALIAVVFFFLWKRKHKSLIETNLIALGDYQFDKRNTELLFDRKKIELTSKEADLLILLYDAVNTTIEREVILNKVWGDEGDYVGRTLDVFISKLRKKLEADPKVKIASIRGVGYKLVLNA